MAAPVTTRTRPGTDWTIERWRTEPAWNRLKDLTLALLAAGLLWAAALMLLG